MIEKVEYEGQLIALIIRSTFYKTGIEFFTPNDFSQQLGYMNRPAGYKISPHIHKLVERKVTLTQEVLFVRSGKVKVNFFSEEQEYIESCILEKNDIILLAACGHGFEMLEDTEMIEVKQGPYCGDEDKTIFTPKHQF